ncbi:uncharacterized protein C8R40DRAFT_1071488 [Lentinula edodes]|uniref:uncharacterized protein n=1 Tax=Lentinula edodes TaxID=5353 RepID=UPI001E8CE0EC|nr:uncharacterized protein C8R40DRAFT_1071488 [Lentinula edodes]KAH7872854.1 hypothetical protein C8R40DRAFT_1071488 [Lentinula edodes]
MDTRHTLHPTSTASLDCCSLDEEFQSLLKMLQAAVHEHKRVFSQRYPGLESYKFVEERPPSFCFFYKEILKLKTLVRKLLTEIARVEQPLVKIKMFLPCTLTTCELLIQAFDDLYVQICEVDQQITLAHVKAIACSGRPSGISLEDQIQQFSSIFPSMFVQTSKITETLKTLLRQNSFRLL